MKESEREWDGDSELNTSFIRCCLLIRSLMFLPEICPTNYGDGDGDKTKKKAPTSLNLKNLAWFLLKENLYARDKSMEGFVCCWFWLSFFFVFICSDYTLSFRTQIHWEVEGIGCFWILFLARIPSVWCFLVFEALPWQKVALVVSGIGMLLTSPGASLVNGASSVCLHRFIFVQPIGWRFFSYLFALDKA